MGDQDELDGVELVVSTCFAVGEFDLEVDGLVGLVAGADGLDRVDTNLGVRDRQAGLGGGAEDCECSGRVRIRLVGMRQLGRR